MLEINEKFW